MILKASSIVPKPSHCVPYLVVSAQSTGVLNVRGAKNFPLLIQNEECVCKMHSLDGGPLPPSVYLGRQNIIHVIKWTRPSSSIFTYCKAIKTWTVGRPGNEARRPAQVV